MAYAIALKHTIGIGIDIDIDIDIAIWRWPMKKTYRCGAGSIDRSVRCGAIAAVRSMNPIHQRYHHRSAQSDGRKQTVKHTRPTLALSTVVVGVSALNLLPRAQHFI